MEKKSKHDFVYIPNLEVYQCQKCGYENEDGDDADNLPPCI